MKSFLRVLTLLTISLYATEAFTSQVHYVDNGMTLESLTQESHNIVVVKPSDKWEVYNEVKIGTEKKRDGSAGEEIVYREHVTLYEVVDVLKSATIKQGDIIKSWHPPTYSLEAMKADFEQGRRRSPVIQQYSAKYPPKSNQKTIVFMHDMKPENAIYRYNGEEGIEALTAVKEGLLKAK